MDVSPLIAADRQVIDSYGVESFRVSGIVHAGAIIVFPDATLSWVALDPADITRENLAPVMRRGGIEILLIGCGMRMVPLPRALREELRAAGIVADAMDTGAACRTYNILLAEDRRVAAALLPAGGTR